MKARLAIALLLSSTAAFAQTASYKLIVFWSGSDTKVIDYPSAARCEAARRAVLAEAERREQEALASMPGSKLLKGPNGAFCIPG